jgi:glucose uptake protein GlcU
MRALLPLLSAGSLLVAAGMCATNARHPLFGCLFAALLVVAAIALLRDRDACLAGEAKAQFLRDLRRAQARE